MWGDVPQADVMDAWRTALAGVDGEVIGLALVALPTSHPEWPPTLGEFVALCKPAPKPQAHNLLPSLPRKVSKGIPPSVQAQLDALKEKWRMPT